jgi:2-haloacid dehalogenase
MVGGIVSILRSPLNCTNGQRPTPPQRLLHIAESLFHDHVPAKKLGLSTVGVHRRANKEGFGATPQASAEPNLEVPDLKSLVAAMGL